MIMQKFSQRLQLPGIASLTLLLSLALAACAGGYGSEATVAPFGDKNMTLQSANSVVVAGTSTKANVLAALGPATVVKFDSGYEVWAYRDKPARAVVPGNEFVILFAPDGIVKKARTRPAYRSQS